MLLEIVRWSAGFLGGGAYERQGRESKDLAVFSLSIAKDSSEEHGGE